MFLKLWLDYFAVYSLMATSGEVGKETDGVEPTEAS